MSSDESLWPQHKLWWGARSEIGPHRKDNQDSVIASDRMVLLADGVGGGPRGDIASSTIVTQVFQLLDGSEPEATLILRDIIHAANADLAQRTVFEPELHGMATTLTGLFLGDGFVRMAHIGDSRAYLYSGGEFAQMSHDDSFVQQLIDDGEIAADAAKKHPLRNVVIRSLSGENTDSEEVTVLTYLSNPGDRWLLASDGLTDYVPLDVIQQLLISGRDPQKVADSLIAEAYRLDTLDNVSVIVCDV
ncbi:MAG: PP2C family protein-serine/threonine phosphatase, partial [Propionibacteriaceae bacterium]